MPSITFKLDEAEIREAIKAYIKDKTGSEVTRVVLAYAPARADIYSGTAPRFSAEAS
jgi:hypothetical protein